MATSNTAPVKQPVAKKAAAAKTNKTKKSLVKVVVLEELGTWVQPASGAKFTISAEPKFPEIVFEVQTQDPGPYQWKWSIKWEAKVSGLREKPRGKVVRTFSQSGISETTQPTWTASLDGLVLGGILTVELQTASEHFKRSVYVIGTNPSPAEVAAFAATVPNIVGFEKLLEQETHVKHFIDLDGEPIVAFDKGFGLTQITNPAPTYVQVWDWKENLKVGSQLYAKKQKEAKAMFATHPTPSATDDMVINETYGRWNGGGYYEWSTAQKKWVRKSDIVCDPATGNIGWSPKIEANKDKTVEELHDRDADVYKDGTAGQSDEHPWQYSGICYAEHVNKK